MLIDLNNQEELRKALQKFYQYFETNGPSPEIYLDIATCHAYLGEFKKAYTILEEALERYPNDLRLQDTFQNIRLETGYPDEEKKLPSENRVTTAIVKQYINAADYTEAILLLDEHPELLSEQVEPILEQLGREAKDFKTKELFKEKGAILKNCRERGTTRAFGDQLGIGTNMAALDNLVDLWQEFSQCAMHIEAPMMLENHPELLGDLSYFVAAELIINARKLGDLNTASGLLRRIDLVRSFAGRKHSEGSFDSAAELSQHTTAVNTASSNFLDDRINRFLVKDEPLPVVGSSWVKYSKDDIWLGIIQEMRDRGNLDNLRNASASELKKVKLGNKSAFDVIDDYCIEFSRNGNPAPAQAAAIKLYTNDDFYKIINAAWRSEYQDHIRHYSAFLLSAFDQQPFPDETILYRGATITDYDTYHKGFKFRWPFIISSTKKKSIGQKYGNTLFVIHIVGQRNIRDISSLSLFPDEEEVLLHPYEIFEVIENKKNVIHIKISDDLFHGIPGVEWDKETGEVKME